MPQLHLYVPEEIAVNIKEKAKANNMTVSGYLSDIIKREFGKGWPDGYFERVCGKWEGEFPELIRDPSEHLEEAF